MSRAKKKVDDGEKGKTLSINNPPKELRDRVEAEAKREGRSLNNYLIQFLSRAYRAIDAKKVAEAGNARG